jgi:hypothetical protein
MESKKRNDPQASQSPTEQQALFLVPTEGSECQLPRSALVCLEECKQREATSLIALKGRAGPTCGMLPGQDLERCDGLLFQPVLPAAWGSVLCCLLSCSAGRLCAGEGRSWSLVGGCSRRHTTSVAEARGTTMGSTWTGNGNRLEAGPIVEERRHDTCTPGRSGAVSHCPGHHVCPHPVPREPSSSWTASTSRHWAF